jgi:hypothetical protein
MGGEIHRGPIGGAAATNREDQLLFIFNEQELAEHNAVINGQKARIAELEAAQRVVWQDRIELRPEHIRGVLEWAYQMGATFGDETPAELWFYENEERGLIAKRLPSIAVSFASPASDTAAPADVSPIEVGLSVSRRIEGGEGAGNPGS